MEWADKPSWLDGDALDFYARHADPRVRALAAGHPLTPEAVLVRLATDANPAVRLAAAAHPTNPQIDLSAGGAWVSCAVTFALNPAATRTQLTGLLASSPAAQPEVRAAIASSALGSDVLAVLAADSDLTVRVALATNPDLAEATRLQLLSDAEEVRVALAGNPSLSPDEVATLAGDQSYLVRAALAGNCRVLDPPTIRILAGNSTEAVRIALASQPWLTLDVASRLAKGGVAVRTALARWSDLPYSLQAQLAQNAEIEVRAGVVHNPATYDGVLVAMRDDPVSEIALVARRRTQKVVWVEPAFVRHPQAAGVSSTEDQTP